MGPLVRLIECQNSNVAAGAARGDGTGAPAAKSSGPMAKRSKKGCQKGSELYNSHWFGMYADQKEQGTISPGRMHGKNSPKRKFSSAMIAKIPLPLSRHIARVYHPHRGEAANAAD